MIEVKNLVKRYGDHTAVDHLSFEIEKGKIYGFLGPNGAGKSTTMNMITGYIASTEGTVVIDGHDILEEPEEAKKCIGYLPEMPPLYFDMTVLEYLKFVADLKKIPKEKSHYDRRNHGHGKDYRHEKSSDQEPFQRLQTEGWYCAGCAWLPGGYYSG